MNGIPEHNSVKAKSIWGLYKVVKYPVEINRDGVESSSTNLLKYIQVERWVGDSPIVKFSREDKHRLAIDMKGGCVPMEFGKH